MTRTRGLVDIGYNWYKMKKGFPGFWEGLGRDTWLGKISAHKVGRGWVEMGRKGALAKEGGMGGAKALSGKEGLGW